MGELSPVEWGSQEVNLIMQKGDNLWSVLFAFFLSFLFFLFFFFCSLSCHCFPSSKYFLISSWFPLWSKSYLKVYSFISKYLKIFLISFYYWFLIQFHHGQRIFLIWLESFRIHWDLFYGLSWLMSYGVL